MDIELSCSTSKDSLVLPVLPDQIEVKTGLTNNTFEVISIGEVGIIGNSKLKTVSISSFFPKYYASYCQYNDIPEPYVAVRMIETWRDSKRPLTLNIKNILVEKMSCMIEEFSYREKGGQPGDVYYDLSLKEYREIKPKIVDNREGKVKVKSVRADGRNIPGTYIVKKGDCLYIIAKRFYNDGSKWKELYTKNKSVIGKDPDLIKPGMVLKL